MTYQEYMNLLQTKVIDILNRGINPWQVEERARNGMTDRYYSGANALMLNISSLLFHNGDMRWYTQRPDCLRDSQNSSNLQGLLRIQCQTA